MRNYTISLLLLVTACRVVDGGLPGDRDIIDLADPPADGGDDTALETEDFAPGDPDNAELLEYAEAFDLDPDPAGVHRPGAKPGEPCELGWFTCESESTLIGCNPATRTFISYVCPKMWVDGCLAGQGGPFNRCVVGRGCISGTGHWPVGTVGGRFAPSPAYLPDPFGESCGFCGFGITNCGPYFQTGGTYLASVLGRPCERKELSVCSTGIYSDWRRNPPIYPAGGQIVCGDNGVWAWSGACSAAGCAPVDRSCLNCPVDGTRCVELVPAPDPRTLSDGDETDADDEAAEGEGEAAESAEE